VLAADLPHRAADLEQTAAAVQALGRRAEIGFVDVSDEKQVDAVVHQALQTFGHLDVLINNAGAMLRKESFATTREEWQRVVDVNLTGTWLMSRCAAQEMVRQGQGKIISISSLYINIVGPLPEAAYYASKAGIANLTRGLALEWGKHGVNVNCIAPGVFYPTQMTQPLAQQPERLESMAQRTLLGRLGDPQRDLKGAVVFLASRASDYVTGQVVFVDGGWTAW
jgi:NAD(P)-dependent dehydrogenase (short-subunit alcohol dehydrogenase family)